MKKFLSLGLIIVCVSVIISCLQKKNRVPPLADILQKKQSFKKISIRFAGEVEFRRTFADAQFMNDKKEIADYEEAQEKSNPLVVFEKNDSLRKRFEESGFVKGRELLLNKFRYCTQSEFQFTNNSGKKINIWFNNITENITDYKMIASSGQDSFDIKIDGALQELKYAFLNIIPGGNKEIVVLDEYYIMNGYNFGFIVYEIITK